MFKIVSFLLVFTLCLPAFPADTGFFRADALAPGSALVFPDGNEKKPSTQIQAAAWIGLGVGWICGLQPYFIKKLYEEGVGGLQILYSYYFWTSVCLLVYFLFQKKTVAAAPEKSRRGLYAVVAGVVFAHVLAVPLKFLSLRLCDALTPEAIVRMAPLMLVFLTVPLLGEKLSKRKLIGVFLGCFGVISVILIKKSGVMGETTPAGVLVALLSAFFYAMSDVMDKIVISKGAVSKAHYVAFGFISGTALFFFVSLVSNASVVPLLNFPILVMVAVNLLGWFGKLFATQHLEATFVRSLISTSSLFTLFWLALFNGRLPEPFFLLMALIAVSSAGVSMTAKQHSLDVSAKEKPKGDQLFVAGQSAFASSL